MKFQIDKSLPLVYGAAWKEEGCNKQDITLKMWASGSAMRSNELFFLLI